MIEPRDTTERLYAENERLHAEIEARKVAAEKVYLEQCAEIERLQSLVNGGIHSEREARAEIETLRALLEEVYRTAAMHITLSDRIRRALETKP